MKTINLWLKIFLTSIMIIGGFNAFSTENNIIEAVVNNPERFEADTKRDAERKPAKVLSFTTIKPADTVLDLFSGAGYYTDMVSRLVGETGKVISHNNNAYINYLGKDADIRYTDNRLPNVQRVISETNELILAEGSVDVALLILTFHDFYYSSKEWKKIDDKDILSRIKNALKNDGSVIIIDHVALAGSGEETGGTLHRIDPAIVKAKMKEAGFQLVDEADFLKNPEDPLAISMGDPKIRGNTSRFVLRFKKS